MCFYFSSLNPLTLFLFTFLLSFSLNFFLVLLDCSRVMMSSDDYGSSSGLALPPSPPSAGGYFGGLGGAQGHSAAHQLSPYLNVNPSYLQSSTPEFIVNQEQKKGRIERSFTGIGGSVLVGAAAGGGYGLYDGVRRTAIEGMTGKLRRTQIINYTMKSGAIFTALL
jgi:hypothetical protein